MARPLSSTVLQNIETAEDSLGMSLARLCIKANLPVLYVSAMLGVSRMTLHTWYRGGAIRKKRKEKIDAFMRLIDDDIQAGVLPKKSLNETRAYAEDFCGQRIPVANKKLG